ncbi:hypothetical protein C5167_032467 [Papaver somniferum]|uniref:Uncharacterized protein n=1 Tax=Papaver somniferum TaxID=3469 RepID=A0A4Y7K8Y0_PAPSO|nr:hypothetical protein C5167_032467 [Papaver somniferum]
MEWNQGSLMVMVLIRLLIQTQQKEMKIPKLMLINAESRRIIDGMESVSFSYSNSNNEDVMMNISHTGNKKQGATFRSYGNADITPNKMRYNRVMPPFFRGCSEEEASHPWLKTPLKMAIGNVNSKHIVLDLKVNWSKVSWYVPYQDENNDIKDDEAISLGVDSVPTTEPPHPDSECINFNLVDEMVESQMNDEFWVLNNTIQLKCAENGGIELMEMELKLVVLCVGSGMNLDVVYMTEMESGRRNDEWLMIVLSW